MPGPDPDRDDAATVRLAHLNFHEFARLLTRWSGDAGRLVEGDGLLFWATATDFAVLLNGAARTDPDLPADEVLRRATAWFGELGRGFTIDVRPGLDDDLAAAVEAAGMVPVLASPQMICTEPVAGTGAPAGLEVVWVDEVEKVAELVAINDAAYRSLGMPAGVIAESVRAAERLLEPHVMPVVVRAEGRPVAAALSFLSHGVAGVHYVGVRDDARGRGLGELVTRLVTNRAFERGAAFVGLQSSSMGESLYRRMGYREIYRYVTYVDFAT
jgi:ribosomal protein S18 acetylase RimI-like enzyme